METSDPPVNSLGLDLKDPTVSSSSDIPHSIPDPNADDTSLTEIAADDAEKSVSADDAKPRDKKKPYVNLERVKTGGIPRDKLSDEELSERMNRIREQNERIKLRRMDVQADEAAFKKTQEVERVRQAKTRRVQESVDRTREQNARRKMDKIQHREWDSGKKGVGDWGKSQSVQPVATETVKISSISPNNPDAENEDGDNIDTELTLSLSPRSRGSGRSRGRGEGRRGRGRGRGQVASNGDVTSVQQDSEQAAGGTTASPLITDPAI